MTVDAISLCRKLLAAENEDRVLAILKGADLWDNEQYWRPIGDNSNNRAIIGNQQEDAVSALAEKITNSVDAILINKCLEAGIEPQGAAAPRSMRMGIAKFFGVGDSESAGMTRFWGTDRLSSSEIDQIAKNIWLSTTGSKTSPSITIADRGEGQTPDSFPRTFMALVGYRNSEGRTESQKANIPFVQGQFNMGGSGVYPFSSPFHGFQLLLSRRNPAHLTGGCSERDRQWGFTIVRRNRSLMKGSIYEYLAPVGVTPKTYGEVLSFAAESFEILPESPPKSIPNKVYSDMAEYGTLVKLYEYQFKEPGLGTSHILMKNGLMRQLELVLPECGIPVRVVEGREFRGKPGSFQTNLFGVLNRLQGLADNSSWDEVEDESDSEFGKSSPLALEGPPVDGEISLEGSPLPWAAYVFRDDAGDRTRSGKYNLIFHLNGQKHAHEAKNFFSKPEVGYRYLAKHNTILLLVDCTSLTIGQREDLFAPSRDRMKKNSLSKELVEVLSDALKTNDTLQKLQLQQHQRRQAERLTNRAPVRAILEQLLKSTPGLARFFRLGPELKITKPFPSTGDGGGGAGHGAFEGKKHPTYFRFNNGEIFIERHSHLGSKIRLQFETDAEDSYFSRPRNQGTLEVASLDETMSVSGNRGELSEGAFTYSLSLPETVEVGQVVEVRFVISDDVMQEPLSCTAKLTVLPPAQTGTGGKGGNRNRGGRTSLSDLDIVRYRNPDFPREDVAAWPDGWNEFVAVKVEENPETQVLTYFVNVDNIHLRSYQKDKIGIDPALLEAKFLWSLVLLSLSVVEDFRRRGAAGESTGEGDEGDTTSSLEDMRDRAIENTTRGIAQLILPMMDAVGTITSDLVEGDE